MYFMTHPEHGAMNVYSPTEVEQHEKLGWTLSTTEAWLGDKLKPAQKPVEPEAKPQRGRPRQDK